MRRVFGGVSALVGAAILVGSALALLIVSDPTPGPQRPQYPTTCKGCQPEAPNSQRSPQKVRDALISLGAISPTDDVLARALWLAADALAGALIAVGVVWIISPRKAVLTATPQTAAESHDGSHPMATPSTRVSAPPPDLADEVSNKVVADLDPKFQQVLHRLRDLAEQLGDWPLKPPIDSEAYGEPPIGSADLESDLYETPSDARFTDAQEASALADASAPTDQRALAHPAVEPEQPASEQPASPIATEPADEPFVDDKGALEAFYSQLNLAGEELRSQVLALAGKYQQISHSGTRVLAGAITATGSLNERLRFGGGYKRACQQLATVLAGPGYALVWPIRGAPLETWMERVGDEGPTHTVAAVVRPGLAGPGSTLLLAPKVTTA